jgi:hypothetical protein
MISVFKPLSAFVVAASLTLTFLSPAPALAQSLPATTGTILLDALEVEDPTTATYSRSAFKHWIDEDGDKFDTRAEVLIAESQVPTKTLTKTSKTIGTGKWYSVYDNLVFTSAIKIDIDHYIPLSEAWKSGANTWTAEERSKFANDLSYEHSLIGVSASQNRSKGDRDPAVWLPKNTAYHCQYVTTWVAVKYRWSLSVDPAEKAAITKILNACPPESIVIVPPTIAKAPLAATADGASKGTSLVSDFILKWAMNGAVIQYSDVTQKFTAGVDANLDGKFTGKEIKATIRVESHRYVVLIAGVPATVDDTSATLADMYSLAVRAAL